ncbi:MAG TPA: hypothetical protein VFR67_00975 [Pilimelia sp.]|nr:hypothetical protein [Pilimelia sp.]
MPGGEVLRLVDALGDPDPGIDARTMLRPLLATLPAYDRRVITHALLRQHEPSADRHRVGVWQMNIRSSLPRSLGRSPRQQVGSGYRW